MGNQDGDHRGYRAVVYGIYEASPLRKCCSGFDRLSGTLTNQSRGADCRKSACAAEPNPHQAMLNTYCIGCHNSRAKVGGLALDGLNLQAAADNAEIWEKALRKLRGHLMPPPGSPQPAQKDVDSFVGWMENTLDTHAKGPKAGHVPIQRLNRTEYVASVKALVGVDLKATDVLPQDGQVDGFDNIAAALTVSPAFLSQYITAARQVAKLAIGSPNPPVASTKYAIAANSNPDVPLPLGTRGGIGFKHNFPADGEYRITINDLGVGIYASTLENQSTLVIMVDGKIVFRQTIGGPDDWQLHAQGAQGTRSNHGAFLEDSRPGGSRCARRRRGVHRPFPCGVSSQYRGSLLRRTDQELLLRAPRAEEQAGRRRCDQRTL